MFSIPVVILVAKFRLVNFPQVAKAALHVFLIRSPLYNICVLCMYMTSVLDSSKLHTIMAMSIL